MECPAVTVSKQVAIQEPRKETTHLVCIVKIYSNGETNHEWVRDLYDNDGCDYQCKKPATRICKNCLAKYCKKCLYIHINRLECTDTRWVESLTSGS
jgi:hypothetical protein